MYVTGKIGGSNYLVKIAKDNMNVFAAQVAVTSGNAYAMVLTGSHVYISTASVPGAVLKYNKADLSLVTSKTLPAGFNDIRSLEYNFGYDQNHIYVNCNTAPGKIAKIQISDMTIAGSLTLNAGEDHLLSGTQMDSSHAYVATLTKPSKIVKIDTTSMTRIGAVALVDGSNQLDDVAAIGSDHAYVYAASYSTPSLFAKVAKATMTIVQVLSVANAPLVDSMVVLKEGIYLGTDTAPARLVKLTGANTAINCVINDWAVWSDCSKTCTGGSRTRVRTIRVAAQNGGTACPTVNSQTENCNAAIVCPTVCTGGKVWSVTGTLPAKTCSNPTPTVSSSNVHQCECPAGAPIWHDELTSSDFAHGHCVKATTCPKKTICTKISCAFQNGRVEVMRTAKGVVQDYHCENMEGRIGGGCTCLCKQ
jgi:hypothetical protein